MTGSPAIEIRVSPSDPRAEYAIRFLFTAAGFPFRIVRGWQAPVLRVAYGEPVNASDLFLPPISSASGRLEVSVVCGVPLAYRRPDPRPTAFSVESAVGFDLIGTTFDLLSRREEIELQPALLPELRFEGYQSDLYDLGMLGRPILNHYVSALRTALEERLAARGVRLTAVPLWKDGRRFAVALSHDVDSIKYLGFREAWVRLNRASDNRLGKRARVESLLGGLNQAVRTPTTWGSKIDPFWNFERWLEVEDRHGFRSTFFIAAMTSRGGLGDPTYRLTDRLVFRGQSMTLQAMLGYFSAHGWEVGLHPSVDTHADPHLLGMEKHLLERAIGGPVIGLRQHRLMFRVPETWRVQQAAGFTYDSTLGFNTRIGFRASAALPFQPFDPQSARAFDLIELPLSIQDGVLMEEEATSLDKAIERSERQLDEVECTQGMAVLLWHPNYAYEEKFPNWLRVYEAILSRLEQRRAFVATSAELAYWWIERARRVDLSA